MADDKIEQFLEELYTKIQTELQKKTNYDLDNDQIVNYIYNILINKNYIKKEHIINIIDLLSKQYLLDNDKEDEYNDEILDEDEYDDEALDEINEYCSYIKDCTSSETIERFYNDEIFGKELLFSYFFCKNIEDFEFYTIIDEDSINPQKRDVVFINQIYRDMLYNIYNYLQNQNLEKDSISSFIASYLNGDIEFSENFYKKYFGNTEINIKEVLTMQKLLIISDYYKINFPYTNKFKCISIMDDMLIKFIRDSNIKDIIKEFKLNTSFQERSITDFFNMNYYKKKGFLKKNNEDTKTLKKINPLFNIDKITND